MYITAYPPRTLSSPRTNVQSTKISLPAEGQATPHNGLVLKPWPSGLCHVVSYPLLQPAKSSSSCSHHKNKNKISPASNTVPTIFTRPRPQSTWQPHPHPRPQAQPPPRPPSPPPLYRSNPVAQSSPTATSVIPTQSTSAVPTAPSTAMARAVRRTTCCRWQSLFHLVWRRWGGALLERGTIGKLYQRELQVR